MAEMVDATDSKPVDASHESSILSPGTIERNSAFAAHTDNFKFFFGRINPEFAK